IADQVDLPRLDDPVDLPQLVHRHLGDVQPAGRVEDYCIERALVGKGDRVAADLDRLSRILAVDGDIDLFAEDLQLVDGRGTLQVGGDQERLAALPAQGQGELAGRGRLALP